MARAGNTKKKPKFVVRKNGPKAAKKESSSKAAPVKAGRPAKKKPLQISSVRKAVKPSVSAKVSSPSAGVKSIRKVLAKTAKKIVQKLPGFKKTSSAAASRAKKNVLRVKTSAKKTALKKTPPKQVSRVKPAAKKKVQKALPAKMKPDPEGFSKKKIVRVKASDRAPGLPKKEIKIPYGDLRVGIVRKRVYSKLAETQNRKPAASRKAPKEPVKAKKQAVAAAVHTPEPREIRSELPSNYGDNLIYLMVRDPQWIYAYWELQPEHVSGNLQNLGGSWDQVCTVLRVYDITENPECPGYQDLYLGGLTDHWHIHSVPGRNYFVEIGLLHRDGRFVSLARSNAVVMPRDSMSDVLDEEWMDIDFDKVYALSGGFDVGKSSQELRKLMQERMQGNLSSGSGSGVGIVTSMSSPGSGSWGAAPGGDVKGRKFFFWLDCEVIVYGGTEPDAKVTFQGKVIKLRPDGTFSFRFALPDGKFVFDAKAESSDGIEERVITPVVQRETSRPAPVFKQGKV